MYVKAKCVVNQLPTSRFSLSLSSDQFVGSLAFPPSVGDKMKTQHTSTRIASQRHSTHGRDIKALLEGNAEQLVRHSLPASNIFSCPLRLPRYATALQTRYLLSHQDNSSPHPPMQGRVRCGTLDWKASVATALLSKRKLRKTRPLPSR